MKKVTNSTQSRWLVEESKKVLVGSGVGLLTVAVVLLFGAFIISSIDFPQKGMPMVALAALGIGCFVAGVVVSKITQCRGLLYGLACGLTVFLVSVLVELFFFQGEMGTLALYKLGVAVLSAMTGGVIGVNKRKKLR